MTGISVVQVLFERIVLLRRMPSAIGISFGDPARSTVLGIRHRGRWGRGRISQWSICFIIIYYYYYCVRACNIIISRVRACVFDDCFNTNDLGIFCWR